MGAFMTKVGENAMNSGTGMDPMASGTAQGGPGMPDPGGAPAPKAPGPPGPPEMQYIQPVTLYSAPPQQNDIQNNFSTSNGYQQRYGLAGRTHF
tara:strand:- start:747 stop:1028 length:282 start_codon:yes stop_codon:yes gene_type:complete